MSKKEFFKEDVLTELRASINSGLYTDSEAMALRLMIINSFHGYLDPIQHCVIHGDEKAVTKQSKFMFQYDVDKTRTLDIEKRRTLGSIMTFSKKDFSHQPCKRFRTLLDLLRVVYKIG